MGGEDWLGAEALLGLVGRDQHGTYSSGARGACEADAGDYSKTEAGTPALSSFFLSRSI